MVDATNKTMCRKLTRIIAATLEGAGFFGAVCGFVSLLEDEAASWGSGSYFSAISATGIP